MNRTACFLVILIIFLVIAAGVVWAIGQQGSASATPTYTYNATTPATTTTYSQPQQNRPPVVTVSQQLEVWEGGTVQISGSVYDPDGDQYTVTWQVNGGTLSSNSSIPTTFTAPTVTADTTFTGIVTVNDTKGAQTTATVQVTVKNQVQQQYVAYTSTRGMSVNVTVSPHTVDICRGEGITITGTLENVYADPLVNLYLDGILIKTMEVYNYFVYNYWLGMGMLSEGSMHVVRAEVIGGGWDEYTFYVRCWRAECPCYPQCPCPPIVQPCPCYPQCPCPPIPQPTPPPPPPPPTPPQPCPPIPQPTPPPPPPPPSQGNPVTIITPPSSSNPGGPGAPPP